MNQISSDDAFRSVEFAENPEPRVPCVLIVDTSQSMQGARINELNAGLQCYREELLADPLASKRVEVAIVTFGGQVKRRLEFVTAQNFQPPTLEANGNTPMGQAINTALDMIEERKANYRRARHRVLPSLGISDYRRRTERPLEADDPARSGRGKTKVLLLLCRRRRAART